MSDMGPTPLEIAMSMMAADPNSSPTTQLNYLQDVMRQGADPLSAFLAGPGAYDPNSFGDTYEEEILPAVTEGQNYLERIQQVSADSVEGLLAAELLAGRSPTQAIEKLRTTINPQTGKPFIDVPKKMDDYGRPTQADDTSAVDGWTKTANDWWGKLLSDKPEERKQTAVPNEHIKRMTDLGFTDPRLSYRDTIQADYSKSEASKGKYDEARGRYDEANKGLKDTQWRADNPDKMAYAPQLGQSLYAGMGKGPGAGAVDPAGGGMKDMVSMVQNAVGGAAAPEPWRTADLTGMLGPVPQAPDPLSSLFNAPMLAQAQGQRQQALDGKRQAFKGYQNDLHGDKMNAYRTKAVQDFLVKSGRTPFQDEFAARLMGR